MKRRSYENKIYIILISVSYSYCTTLPATIGFAQQKPDAEANTMIKISDGFDLSPWIANGGDINKLTKEGNTLLMSAVDSGDCPAVRNLSFQPPGVIVQNKAGAAALMHAENVIKHIL